MADVRPKLIMKFKMKFTHCCDNAAIKMERIEKYGKNRKGKKDNALIDMNQYPDMETQPKI